MLEWWAGAQGVGGGGLWKGNWELGEETYMIASGEGID